MGFDFEILYKPGRDNKVADALSRIDDPHVLSFTFPTFPWLEELRRYYSTTPAGLAFLSQIATTPQHFPHHRVHDGLVYYSGRIEIPDVPDLRCRIIAEHHATPMGGHSGLQPTLRRLAASFYWPHMRQSVTDFIRTCATCQQVKYPTHKPYGLLQLLPIPQQVWDDLTMDFITHLPPSQGKTTIWVIVDCLSKSAHFVALPPHFTAVTLATQFQHTVYRLHGLSRSIVSDRDPLFLSRFWQELFKQLGTTLRHSSAYHPQTDGQSEVVNRCLDPLFRQ